MSRGQIIKELEDIILDLNLFLTHKFGNEFSIELAKKINSLTPNQQIIVFLVEKKGITQVKDLASFLNISTSAVSQIVGKLENQEILTRSIDPSNRRNTIIDIGPMGREIINEMEKIKSEVFNKYLLKMEEEDLINFKNSFKKFLEIVVENKEERQ